MPRGGPLNMPLTPPLNSMLLFAPLTLTLGTGYVVMASTAATCHTVTISSATREGTTCSFLWILSCQFQVEGGYDVGTSNTCSSPGCRQGWGGRENNNLALWTFVVGEPGFFPQIGTDSKIVGNYTMIQGCRKQWQMSTTSFSFTWEIYLSLKNIIHAACYTTVPYTF